MLFNTIFIIIRCYMVKLLYLLLTVTVTHITKFSKVFIQLHIQFW